jgi:potassium-transporting ATPase KdpC subunit
MKGQLRPALVIFFALSILTGIAYPLVVTGLAQLLFHDRASGSLELRDGRVVGSRLIGQPFAAPGHFWARPSATGPVPYNAAASSGSNLGPTNPALLAAVRDRVAALRAADPSAKGPVPVDLVTASGSGLDPDISVAGALFQVPRVARARGLSETRVRELVAANTRGRTLGFLGEPRVNVLALNLALDGLR